jgi:hypothetical protein
MRKTERTQLKATHLDAPHYGYQGAIIVRTLTAEKTWRPFLAWQSTENRGTRSAANADARKALQLLINNGGLCRHCGAPRPDGYAVTCGKSDCQEKACS